MRINHLSRRRFVSSVVTISVCTLTGYSSTAPAQATTTHNAQRLRLIGEARLPHKLQYQGTTVGGLSGLNFDAASGNYYLLSDDGGSRSSPRFYTARLQLSAAGVGDIELTGVTFLQGVQAPDPQALRWHAGTQSLFWTSEGNAAKFAAPTLHLSRLDSSLQRTFAMPALFDFGLSNSPRINKTPEGLALAPDGQTAWLAIEAALRSDGPVPGG